MNLIELHKFICLLAWHGCTQNLINIFIIYFYCFNFISLIVNNHVMENYACFHDVLKRFMIGKPSRSTYNCKSCLKHALHPFYVPFELLQIIFLFVQVELVFSSQMLTTLDIYYRQGSFPLCNYYHGFKNWTNQTTKKGGGNFMVKPIIEPVMS